MSESTGQSNAKHRHLLFVDDEPRVQQSIARTLRGVDKDWQMHFAGSVDEALQTLAQKNIHVVVTDVTMPNRDGFDLIRSINSDESLKHIPIVVLTGLADDSLKRRALDAGAMDLVGKPIQREDLIARLRCVLRIKEHEDSLATLNATLEQQVVQRTADLAASRMDLLLCLAQAGECRDVDTGRHLVRVARYARCLANALKLPAEEVQLLYTASPLHDIGKIGVPDVILLKPDVLTDQERAIMQRHCELGHHILSRSTTLADAFIENAADTAPRSANPLLAAAASIALCHHERWDGTGYPNKLCGDAIPIFSRIVAVADVYDALTTLRPYKRPFTHEHALKILRDGSGTHFDPAIITAVETVQNEFNHIRQSWSDSVQDKAILVSNVESLNKPLAA